MAENYVMFPAWPLSKYLAKITDQKPKEVIKLIKSIGETRNFRINLDLIECALKISSSLAKEIIPLARKWIITPYPSLIPEKLAESYVKFSDENEQNSAWDLLEIIFLDVKVSDTAPKTVLKEAYPYFDLWAYEKILNGATCVVFKKKPCDVVEVLYSVLFKAIRLERSNISHDNARAHNST